MNKCMDTQQSEVARGRQREGETSGALILRIGPKRHNISDSSLKRMREEAAAVAVACE